MAAAGSAAAGALGEEAGTVLGAAIAAAAAGGRGADGRGAPAPNGRGAALGALGVDDWEGMLSGSAAGGRAAPLGAGGMLVGGGAGAGADTCGTDCGRGGEDTVGGDGRGTAAAPGGAAPGGAGGRGARGRGPIILGGGRFLGGRCVFVLACGLCWDFIRNPARRDLQTLLALSHPLTRSAKPAGRSESAARYEGRGQIPRRVCGSASSRCCRGSCRCRIIGHTCLNETQQVGARVGEGRGLEPREYPALF